MKLALIFLAAVIAICCDFVSGLFVPVIVTSGTTTAATLTTSVGGIAAGAAVAATAGIVGLGVAALLAAQDDSSNSTPYGRRKRNIGEETVREMFALVAEIDINACGLKLVCDIYQKPLSSLSDKERAIVRLVGENPKPVSPEKLKDPRSPYQSAAILGREGKKCSEVYASCPFDEDKIYSYLDNLEFEGDTNFRDVVLSQKKQG